MRAYVQQYKLQRRGHELDDKSQVKDGSCSEGRALSDFLWHPWTSLVRGIQREAGAFMNECHFLELEEGTWDANITCCLDRESV